jgi:hypothetical protein
MNVMLRDGKSEMREKKEKISPNSRKMVEII